MLIITVLIIACLAIGPVRLIDLWNRKCSVLRRLLRPPIPFIPLFAPMLYYALFDPPQVRQSEPPALKNSIERWKEWLINRYNPGYFMGGRIAPLSLGPWGGQRASCSECPAWCPLLCFCSQCGEAWERDRPEYWPWKSVVADNDRCGRKGDRRGEEERKRLVGQGARSTSRTGEKV